MKKLIACGSRINGQWKIKVGANGKPIVEKHKSTVRKHKRFIG